MTIAIDLPPETLEALRTDAGTLKQPAEQAAAECFSPLVALDEDEETAVNTALDELASGKGHLFSEFANELSVRFAVRYETP